MTSSITTSTIIRSLARAPFRACLALIILTLTSCSSESAYKISGDIEGGKEMTLRLVIYSPSGVTSEVLATRSGHFEYANSAPDDGTPLFIEIYTNDYKPVGLLSVARDTEANLTINPDGIEGFKNQTEADGVPGAFAKALNAWLAKNKNIDNGTVADFVKANPANPAAYAVLSTLYNASAQPEQAALLLGALKTEARPSYYNNGFAALIPKEGAVITSVTPDTMLSNSDTLFAYNPAHYRHTLIVFDTDGKTRSDSVVPNLHRLGKTAATKQLLVLEHNLSADTLTWKRGLRNDIRNINRETHEKHTRDSIEGKKTVLPPDIDKISWTSVWTGAGPAAPFADQFGITDLPYYIVVDRSGTITYRGTSLPSAESHLQ